MPQPNNNADGEPPVKTIICGGQSKNRKPLIAVTGPHKRLTFGWWATRLLLQSVGCHAHYITAATSSIPPGINGVIIGGGDDIDPKHYGDSGDAGANYDAARDQLEMTMLQNALDTGIPILGICRGAQLINVVLGGTLHRDIRPKRQNTPNKNSIFGIKWADIEPSSRLAKTVRRKKLKINSLHNQAVKNLSNKLLVSAYDRDGFVQAFENKQDLETLPWITGVQWHPEYMPYAWAQRRLFKAFAKQARHTNQSLVAIHPLPNTPTQ